MRGDNTSLRSPRSQGMDKTFALVWVVCALCLFSVEAVHQVCQVTNDCGLDERCCGELCLARRSCQGICTSHGDCDEKYGEKCINKRCECVYAPCKGGLGSTNSKRACNSDLNCPANETCIKGLCQNAESHPARDPNFSPAVLAVVATVGLVIFVAAFYLCLRKQHTSRPSLAAKEAHIRAMERSRSTLNEHRVSFDDNADMGNSRRGSESSRLCQTNATSDEQPGNNPHEAKQEGNRKRPTSGLVGSIDLSAIIEEDEVSEATIKQN